MGTGTKTGSPLLTFSAAIALTFRTFRSTLLSAFFFGHPCTFLSAVGFAFGALFGTGFFTCIGSGFMAAFARFVNVTSVTSTATTATAVATSAACTNTASNAKAAARSAASVATTSNPGAAAVARVVSCKFASDTTDAHDTSESILTAVETESVHVASTDVGIVIEGEV